jgi:hypothetical protein
MAAFLVVVQAVSLVLSRRRIAPVGRLEPIGATAAITAPALPRRKTN